MKELLLRNGHLVLFGFLLAFLSSFGQTFLISLYVPHVQAYFGLSDGLFSGFYAAATLGSAFSLAWLGRHIDTVRLTRFTVRVMLGMALALVVLSQAYWLPMLVLGLYGVRLFGQGLLHHTALTSMARFFHKDRGKAIGLAALGHPAGEAILPTLVLLLISAIGWRYGLLVMAGVTLLAIPMVLALLMRHKAFSRLRVFIPEQQDKTQRNEARPWNILRSRAFWLLAPSNFASASIGTAVIFFQFKLAAERDWDARFIAAAFGGYAAGSALSTLLAGWLTDRFGAKRVYPLYLAPFLLGVLGFSLWPTAWTFALLLAGIGSSTGLGGTIKNAALAEYYGTAILGSVRSLFTTVMVFATAVGPVLFGVLLDAEITFNTLMRASFVALLLASFNATRGVGGQVA